MISKSEYNIWLSVSYLRKDDAHYGNLERQFIKTVGNFTFFEMYFIDIRYLYSRLNLFLFSFLINSQKDVLWNKIITLCNSLKKSVFFQIHSRQFRFISSESWTFAVISAQDERRRRRRRRRRTGDEIASQERRRRTGRHSADVACRRGGGRRSRSRARSRAK